MGLSNWFQTFCSAVSVKSTGTISSRIKQITKRINLDYWGTDSETTHSFYAGSFGRGTAVKITSDVDVVVVLPYSEYKKYNDYTGNGQSALLQSVKNCLKKTYASSSVSSDGQIVQISFTDGLKFEVVPAFKNKDVTYTYADTNDGGSWKSMDPKSEIAAVKLRNDVCNKNLVNLCRMMRAWKNRRSVPISGVLIDTLAYQFIATWEYRNKSFFYYDYMCRDFFDYMALQDKEKEYWKAPGSGRWVYASKNQFQYKARVCCNLAKEAIEHEIAKPSREYSAKLKWREIFGTSYPS